MKIILLCLSIVLSFSLSAKEPKPLVFGKKMILKKSQSVSELLKNPKRQVNKHVQVTGKIKKVCPMMGCWLDLEDPKTKKIIKVKVKDGDIVFPKNSINKQAIIEGKLTKKMMSKAKAIRYYKHLAEELGETFDPKSVTGPVEMWEVKGRSAIIK